MQITQQWNEDDSNYIRKKVIEYNLSKLLDEEKNSDKDISFILRDKAGTILGGLTGKISWHNLHIDFLWVDDSLRGKGYGKELLESAEIFAKENKCKLILLHTFSFQAPGFYQKYGYQIVGVNQEHRGIDFQKYFLEKKLI